MSGITIRIDARNFADDIVVLTRLLRDRLDGLSVSLRDKGTFQIDARGANAPAQILAALNNAREGRRLS